MNLSNILSCQIVQWTPKYFPILDYGLLSSIFMVLRINGLHVFANFCLHSVCVCVYSISIQLSTRFGCHRSNRQEKKMLFMFLCRLAWYFIVNNTSQNDNSCIENLFEAHCYLIYNSFRLYIAGCTGKGNSHVKHFQIPRDYKHEN